MFGTRFLSLILAFCLGFSLCGGIIAFGAMAAISKFRVRDLEKHGINIPDEAFMTEDREVDLFNLSIVEFINEVKHVSSLGDQVTIEFIQDRYGILIHEKLDEALTDDMKKMPLKQLLSKEGVAGLLSSVYIGNVENYTCYQADGTVGGDPKDETTYWMTEDGVKITGIEDIIADFSLGDFLSGNINTNTLFDEICIGDILGYTEIDGEWVDKEGNEVTGVIGAFAGSTIHSVGDDVNNVLIGDVLGYEQDEESGDWYKTNEAGEREKVTGVLAVFADCNIDGIGDKLEDAQLGEILGYELVDGTWYKRNSETNELEKVTGAMAVFANSNINGVGDEIEKTEVGKLLGYDLIEGTWYKPADVLDEHGNRVPVDGFMSKISASTINNMDGVFETLVVGDIVKDTDEGLFSIIDPDTKIDEIGSAVNDSIMHSPLQFFINQKLISFETGEGEDMSETLDYMSTNDLAKIYPTDEDFNTQKNYYSEVWTEVKSGDTVLYYTVPNWRTQPLSTSFAYIIKLFPTPSLPISE